MFAAFRIQKATHRIEMAKVECENPSKFDGWKSYGDCDMRFELRSSGIAIPLAANPNQELTWILKSNKGQEQSNRRRHLRT
jgi:hypothetical protein